MLSPAIVAGLTVRAVLEMSIDIVEIAPADDFVNETLTNGFSKAFPCAARRGSAQPSGPSNQPL